jgi:hypothetical protein
MPSVKGMLMPPQPYTSCSSHGCQCCSSCALQGGG